MWFYYPVRPSHAWLMLFVTEEIVQSRAQSLCEYTEHRKVDVPNQRESEAAHSPVFHHVTIKTTKLQEMVDW